jgi:hypothetical protein
MKVVAINGSPKMDRGTTALILAPFLEGLRGSGGRGALLHQKARDQPLPWRFSLFHCHTGGVFSEGRYADAAPQAMRGRYLGVCYPALSERDDRAAKESDGPHIDSAGEAVHRVSRRALSPSSARGNQAWSSYIGFQLRLLGDGQL